MNISWSVLVFLVIFQLRIFQCFNVDTNFPIVYEDPYQYLNIPSNKSSYFGYSLALYSGNHINLPWIQIGAPRGNSPRVDFQNPGVVFQCAIGAKCTLIDLDTEPRIVNGFRGNYINKLDNAWIGGSMDISHKNNRIVTCGFRWTNYKKQINVRNDDYRMLGSCYWAHVNDNTTQKLLPLLNPTRDIYSPAPNRNVYYYAQGESGFAINMPPKADELYLGAPGVFNWAGTVMRYRDSTDDPPVANKLRSSPRRRVNKRYASPDEFGNLQITNPTVTSQIENFDLFGYAVTSGYFYNKTELLYVAGAPKSRDYLGQVLIHGFFRNVDSSPHVRETKYGTQMGEYFGGALTAGDINNDGLDDLIIGAPFYTGTGAGGRYNEGRIYVFFGSSKGRLQEPDQGRIIVGRSVGGQFGTTVQFLGDINHDTYGDLAVAAPYEEELSGVVYVYRGTKAGLDVDNYQRIVGRDISQNIRGFGISISRPADVDFNSYDDIAIGAYKSGHAVLLRTRPTVVVHHSLEIFHSPLDYNQKSFEARACFWYSLDQKDYAVRVTRIIAVDDQIGRASLRDVPYSELLELTPNATRCQNFTIYLKEKFLNHYDPISLSLSHQLVTDSVTKTVIQVTDIVSGMDLFCPRCPVYDRFRSSDTATVNVPFALGCGSDDICVSNLELRPKFLGTDKDDAFILGSSTFVRLETTVQNTGERAYLTQIAVTLPEGVNFRQTPALCVRQNISQVMCPVDNPLDANSTKSLALDLDMSSVNSGRYEKFLVINVKVATSSENLNRNNEQNLKLKLKREADITISGKSDKQSYYYGNITTGQANFTQTYQVQKIGISPVEEVLIEIDIPHSFTTEDNEIIDFVALHPPRGALAGQPLNCMSNFTYIVDTQKNIETPINLEEINAENNDLMSMIPPLPDVDQEEEKVKEDSGKKLLKKRSISTESQVEVFANNNSDVVGKRSQKLVDNGDLILFENRTFYVNCSTKGFVCSKLVCTAGPFRSQQHIGVVDVKMEFDVANLSAIIKKKDVILFTTQGTVTIQRPSKFVQSGDLPDTVLVSSIFVGDTVKSKIELWIIIVSVIAGLLLLALVIFGLVKAGFFRRTKKEELEQLKEEIGQQQNFADVEDKTEESDLVDKGE